VQANGKVKFSTRPGEHQGLGVSHYLWASSPLRRYSDLVNQRQLLAVVNGEKPPYSEGDPELFAILTDFEATYAQYADFQDRMERYGAQTARAVENFPVSGVRFPRAFIRALGLIKSAAATVNARLGNLTPEKAEAIRKAAEQVVEGVYDDQFAVGLILYACAFERLLKRP
jgi:hypothetical protein